MLSLVLKVLGICIFSVARTDLPRILNTVRMRLLGVQVSKYALRLVNYIWMAVSEYLV